MSILKNLSIGTQLLFIAVIVFIGFMAIGGIYLSSVFYQEKLRSYQANELIFQKKIIETQYKFLDARRIEKGFLLLLNENSIRAHEVVILQIRENLNDLDDLIQIEESDSEVPFNINLVKEVFTTYASQFNKIVGLWKIVGLNKNEGLRGTLRKSAHELEKYLNVMNERELLVYLLMMRRYEKDFMMRKNEKYIEQFLQEREKFLTALSVSSLTADDVENVKTYVEAYHHEFIALSELYVEIFAEVENLNQLFIKTLPVFEALIAQAESRYQSFITAVQDNHHQALIIKSAIIVIITLICISLAILIRRGINQPVKRMVTVMTRLADGDLNIEIPFTKNQNEMGTFARTLRVFKEKLIARKYLREVTEREREVREFELKQARDAALAGERAKTAFFANLSHEIRTPMNTIIGFSEVMLQDCKLDSKTGKYVDTIYNSAQALLSLINNILDLSKLESNKLSLEVLCFHLPNMLKKTMQLLEYQAKENQVVLKLEYAAELPYFFTGDPNRLRQIILNLVGNAVKFTKNGYVTVSIKPNNEPGLLYFSVSDSGIGMTQEQIESVFERFNQADESTTRRFGGTGLGTTISKQLVELMGGEIWVESEPKSGSIFHFTVNLQESIETADCLYSKTEVLPKEYISPRIFKILLAEDIEANADLVILRLKQQGHVVVWVKNGREAIKEACKQEFDVVLMDVMMPELDGLEATKRIRKHEKNLGINRLLPIIALTASTVESNEKCIAAGMDTVERKPIDFNSLFSTIENVVPEGYGQINKQLETQATVEYQFDFSPLAGTVNYKKALENWRDPKSYANALFSFKIERIHDAEKMEDLLKTSRENLNSVCMTAHTLKGVAGNLGIERVADLATEIDTNLSIGQIDQVIQKLDILHQLLQEVDAAIAKLDMPIDELHTVKVFDKDLVTTLLVKLFSALNELNPDAADPYLNELAEYLVETDLMYIRESLKNFDFDNAQTQVKALAQKLALNIEEIKH